MTQIYFSEARHADDVLRLTLGAAQLPTDDLGGPDQMFFSLSDDEGLIGFIGLEGNGADRLCSLVVLPTRRGKGYGRMLVERLEGVVDGAVKRLHLLTSGTGEFFRRLGYADADRDAAPAVIAATA
jgi:N-acetylglutamate synthase-like GNAT family acetyltransferase